MAPKKRTAGLGRGLNALLGEAVRAEPTSQAAAPASGVGLGQLLPIADIAPHPDQPRRHFDPAAIAELAESIAARGVIQPIIVRPAPSGKGYQLVAGERRWRAAQQAQLHEIPAIVRELDDKDTLAIALIENIQRADLNAIEEAQAYANLVETQNYTPQDVAKLVDKSRSHIVNMMRLLSLPPTVLGLVVTAQISMGHARALINCDNAGEIAQLIVAKGLSVRATEKLARAAVSGTGAAKPARTRKPGADSQLNPDLAAVESHLEDLLGLKVKISLQSDNQSGAISVQFASLDQLDLICERLSGER